MLDISQKHYIAKGHNRQCFHHPDNQNLCIKVDIGDTSKFDYQFFSEYLGPIKTNMGVAHVYGLILDEQSNQVSKTLKHYIDHKPTIIDKRPQHNS